MPNINELKSSRFLKKEDCGEDGIIVEIEAVKKENVAVEGADPELKYCLHFKGIEKPMVLNSTNGQIIAKFLKTEEMDEWKGYRIVLYNDPNVGFGGKITGGIRARAIRKDGETAKVADGLPF